MITTSQASASAKVFVVLRRSFSTVVTRFLAPDGRHARRFFNIVSEHESGSFLLFFSIFFNAVNTIPLRPATHPRANEDEVAFDLREPSYTGNSMLSTLVSPSLPLEGRYGGRRWNPQSSLPAIKDRSSNIESHPIGHRGSRRHP